MYNQPASKIPNPLATTINAGCIGDSALRRRTTAFTCRAGCKELDASKKRHAGPVKCNALFGGILHA
jgi:hypothetical protein